MIRKYLKNFFSLFGRNLQSTNVGRAYVVSGGVGQRSIVIFVEASNTLYFRYVGQIYGV